MEVMDEKSLKKISEDRDFDFNEVEKLIEEKMQEDKIKSKVQKIILSLQNFEGKDLLVGTVFISVFGMIKINISLDEMKITDFEKKSFLDILKVSKKEEQ